VVFEQYDLFISYSREDSERVRPLAEALRALGYHVFLDLESIQVGERWKQRLETAVRQSRALVLCWSAQAKASDYVQFEYHKAEGLGKRVMPWLLDSTQLPAMVEIQGITLGDPVHVAAALAHQIGWSVTRRRWITAIIAGSICAGTVAAWLKPRPAAFDFVGVVMGDNLPLTGVTVTYEDANNMNGVHAVTDANGRYKLTIQGDRPQYIRLRFAKDGYDEEAVNASTETSIASPFAFTLKKK
jgi:hypothetical protein